MGSNGGIASSEDEITVMVTGFAPFRVESPKNPAWEITRRLPPFLGSSKSSLGSEGLAQEQISSPRIKILIYPEPIKVAYKSVKELVPRLWEYADNRTGVENAESNSTGVDYMIHIGMASGRRYYSIERRGHRQGYKMKDVDGEILEDDGGRKHSKNGQHVKEVVDKQDHASDSKVLLSAGVQPSTHGTGVESWINNVGKSGDSIQEVIRNEETKNIKPQNSAHEAEDTKMDASDASEKNDTRQKTPKEVQTSQAETRQPDAPSEAWMRQKARYQSQRTSTPIANPWHDATDVGELTEKWIWEGLPKEIETDLNIDDVWKRWRLALPDTDARISEDAGRYLCDFIYYSSLAELTKRQERKRVLFLHVPVGVDEESVMKGVEITCELIRAIVASDITKKKHES